MVTSGTIRRGDKLPKFRLFRVLLLGAAGLAAAASCATKAAPARNPRCPNEYPKDGDSCAPGLECHYIEPSACSVYFTARCTAAARWDIQHTCTLSTAGSGGQGGGAGGSGGESCIDPVPGAPKVTSPAELVLPPDGGSSSYTLTFDEPIAPGLASHLTWDGAGSLVGASKINETSYLVKFSGMVPGDSAKLTVDGASDSCGTALAAPVEIAISLRPSCHYFYEDFEGDFLGGGWSTVDGAGDGNVWASNDAIDGGVPNHTKGDGRCASANDAGTSKSSKWDARLVSPSIDLTGAKNAVLHFDSSFHDPLGDGEAWVEASTDGTRWHTLTTWSDDRDARREHVDLGDYVGAPVHLRWRYKNSGGLGSWWDVDGVCVEEYTKPSCPCPAGGITEANDLLGKADGNGKYATAEKTPVTFTGVGQKLSVCGTLEDASASGDDYYAFTVDTTVAKAPLVASVDYCVENAFEDVNAGVWSKLSADPLALNGTVHSTGSFKVKLGKDGLNFLSLGAAAPPYTKARYAVTIKVISASPPLLHEGFETWPPAALAVTNDDACLAWAQSGQSVDPPGGLPTEGSFLAYFNSYDCLDGSESLESNPLSFAGKTDVTLSYDLFHDTSYPSATDSIQVEYKEGAADWLPIGPKAVRPAAVGGWKTESIDLTPLAGKSAVRLRLRAQSAYGGNLNIDNVLVLAN